MSLFMAEADARSPGKVHVSRQRAAVEITNVSTVLRKGKLAHIDGELLSLTAIVGELL
jgi:hypothetical protein